jgi:hypothetical protein
MKVTLTARDADLAEPIMDLLDQHGPVQQQKILELCVARHALRTGTANDARFVIDSFYKHVCQIIAGLDIAGDAI